MVRGLCHISITSSLRVGDEANNSYRPVTGSAIRMMQFLYSARRSSLGHFVCATEPTEKHACTIEARTFWVCFNVSSMIDMGNLTQPLLPLEEVEGMSLAEPLSNIDFALSMEEPVPSARAVNDSHRPSGIDTQQRQRQPVWNVDDGFQIVSQGIAVWKQAMVFLRNEGRRAPGMCRAENSPWSPTSPWSVITTRLENWRALQHVTLHHPSQSVAAYSSVGNGEIFVFVNMIYYARYIC